MTRALVVLLAVTAMLLVGGRWVARPFGPEVAARVLETSARDHSETLLRLHRERPEAARGYALPVLVPIDLLFLLSLGALFVVASLVALSFTAVAPRWSALVLILPLIYVVADTVEDVLLVRMLNDSAAVVPLSALAAQLTRVKLASLWLCLSQVGLLAVAAAAAEAIRAVKR